MRDHSAQDQHRGALWQSVCGTGCPRRLMKRARSAKRTHEKVTSARVLGTVRQSTRHRLPPSL